MSFYCTMDAPLSDLTKYKIVAYAIYSVKDNMVFEAFPCSWVFVKSSAFVLTMLLKH
jgi:hypothetical protein